MKIYSIINCYTPGVRCAIECAVTHYTDIADAKGAFRGLVIRTLSLDKNAEDIYINDEAVPFHVLFNALLENGYGFEVDDPDRNVIFIRGEEVHDTYVEEVLE